jgi:DUF4097 and DUF4098 domain-containing protein YvlB
MMETILLDVGERPKVKFLSIGGDLRLSGRESTQFEAKAPSRSDLVGEQKGEWVEVRCNSDCLVFLPRDATIEGETVGGDLRATNITGGLLMRNVGGDVSLRGVAMASFETIGGDLHVRKGTGDLSLDRLGGDALVDRISGDVRLRSVGGDLSLRRVDGLVEVAVGGDASLSFTTFGGEKISANAGGDLSCHLPENASAQVHIHAGGEVHVGKTSTEEIRVEGDIIHKFGEGEVEVKLNAGGDVWVGGLEGTADLDFASLGSTIAKQVESEIEAGMAEMEASLEAMGAGLGAFESDRIGEQVRRAVSRARRNADRASRKAHKGILKARKAAKGRRLRVDFDMDLGGKSKRVVSDEERLAILRMLEKGTITVDEAENLLQALEGDR